MCMHMSVTFVRFNFRKIYLDIYGEISFTFASFFGLYASHIRKKNWIVLQPKAKEKDLYTSSY